MSAKHTMPHAKCSPDNNELSSHNQGMPFPELVGRGADGTSVDGEVDEDDNVKAQNER